MHAGPKRPSNFLGYHRRRTLRIGDAPIPPRTEASSKCIRNLANYAPPRSKLVFPRARCSAVLVALFVGRHGDLYVLLSRRSSNLRSFAGDTALPGGKVEPADETFEDAARREAFEEIGLTTDKRKVPLLCILEPFLASNETLVIPVVALILDNTLQPMLNAAEVESLFSHPLASFLSSASPFPAEPESVEVPYHTHRDVEWGARGGLVRVHTFLTGREAGGIKPVFGLTAGIMIRVAEIGYGRGPDFAVMAPGQLTAEQRIAHALLTREIFQKAMLREGLEFDPEMLAAIAAPETKPDRRRKRGKL